MIFEMREEGRKKMKVGEKKEEPGYKERFENHIGF